MSKTGKNEKLAEKLLYKPDYPADSEKHLAAQANRFCEDYKAFLDRCKTERETAAECEKRLLKAGYVPFDDTHSYLPGDKIYRINRGKCVLAATIGSAPLEQGMHLNIAHIDAPRLDLRPNPLYEKDHFSLFKTHYYGGVRKYQWAAIPLAIHGVFCRPDGETVQVCIGEDEKDPVFCITDLLPHLSREQNERKLSDGIRGEELNVLIGSEAVDDPELKEAVKLRTMVLLHDKYGIVERDFCRAEIEIVPAFHARDIGFDRSMVGAYGQDDRVDAYPALMAEIAADQPLFTTVCVLTDKEEVGSDGVTGMHSDYAFDFLRQLCRCQNADPIHTFQASKCISADVTAAYDPTWESVFEPQNGTYAGRGIAFFKYTGGPGKSGASDASAELVAYVADLCAENQVSWQIGELGKLDAGGGGTIAKYVAMRDIDTLDVGVPVLSMHSPFEVTHKADILMAYRLFAAFNAAKK